ncbi:MAG TPA: DMT family transporter [Phycisphaerae bacterium]|nr:DMT family transporter [Phycisphaerae bacterium]
MLSRRAIDDLGLTCLLVGVTAIWGWTFTVVKEAIDAYGVLGFLAIRFTIATLVMLALSWRRMDRRTMRTGVAIGAVLAVAYFFQTLGQKYTTPTNCGLVTGLFILFVPIFDRLLYGLRIRRFLWAAVAVSFVGMLLLVGDSPRELRIGDALTAVCAACYGLHISLLSHHSRGHHPLALATFQMLTVAVLTGAAWPIFEPLALPSPAVWRALLITGLLASALAFYIQTLVQRRLSALRTGIIITAEPMFAALFGYLLAGDRLTGLQVVGGVLLMAAILASEIVPAWQKARRPQ